MTGDPTMNEDPRPTVPNIALAGLLITLTSWQVAFASLLLDGNLPAKIACGVFSVAATIFLATIGRKAAAPYWRHGGRVVLSPAQSLCVVLYFVAVGASAGIALAINHGV